MIAIPDDAHIFLTNHKCPEALEMVKRGLPIDPDMVKGYSSRIIGYPKGTETASQVEMIEMGMVGVYTTKKEYLEGIKGVKKHIGSLRLEY